MDSSMKAIFVQVSVNSSTVNPKVFYSQKGVLSCSSSNPGSHFFPKLSDLRRWGPEKLCYPLIAFSCFVDVIQSAQQVLRGTHGTSLEDSLSFSLSFLSLLLLLLIRPVLSRIFLVSLVLLRVSSC